MSSAHQSQTCPSKYQHVWTILGPAVHAARRIRSLRVCSNDSCIDDKRYIARNFSETKESCKNGGEKIHISLSRSAALTKPCFRQAHCFVQQRLRFLPVPPNPTCARSHIWGFPKYLIPIDFLSSRLVDLTLFCFTSMALKGTPVVTPKTAHLKQEEFWPMACWHYSMVSRPRLLRQVCGPDFSEIV